MKMTGYALSQNEDGSWTYRAVLEDWVLNQGETFYPSTDDFPQEAKDWFQAHPNP
jgi:hypothetical protein